MFGKADDATFDGVMASLEKPLEVEVDIKAGDEEVVADVEAPSVEDGVKAPLIEVGVEAPSMEEATEASQPCPLPERSLEDIQRLWHTMLSISVDMAIPVSMVPVSAIVHRREIMARELFGKLDEAWQCREGAQ